MSKKSKKKGKNKLVRKGDILPSNQKLVDKYKLYCRNEGLTQDSIEAKCGNDLRLFLQYLGDKKLTKVNHEDVEEYFTYCIEVRGNQDVTVARKHSSMKSFFDMLILQEVKGFNKNPMNKVPKPKEKGKVREPLTKEDYRKLLSYVDSIGDLRGGALVSLFYSSGCRLKEIHQQNRDSLDFDRRQFKVLGKGNRERKCNFSEDAKIRILRYLESRTDDLKPLFISSLKKRMHRKTIEDYFKNLGERAGINGRLFPHRFRHTRATQLIKDKVPIIYVQKQLGHRNISTTQGYIHIDIDETQDIIDQVDKAS